MYKTSHPNTSLVDIGKVASTATLKTDNRSQDSLINPRAFGVMHRSGSKVSQHLHNFSLRPQHDESGVLYFEGGRILVASQ
jgi:hypothetical protein